jgi:hypothetical protein
MRLNENLQVTASVSGPLRTFLYDTLQLIARAVNRRAELNEVNRTTNGVDTADDVVIDDDAKGLVLKDSADHYWRVTVNTSGALVTTDLGTTKP